MWGKGCLFVQSKRHRSLHSRVQCPRTQISCNICVVCFNCLTFLNPTCPPSKFTPLLIIFGNFSLSTSMSHTYVCMYVCIFIPLILYVVLYVRIDFTDYSFIESG